jgi:predicted ATPase/DNA-binding CsgD family transcriptional regulator/tetratricopeptide (TPR) repeat protein
VLKDFHRRVLAPLTSADNIVTTVIGVLGIMIGDEGTPQEELVKFLSGRNLLLVMDNFEHVLDGADPVADILNVAPNVKILTTSRATLNLSMEHIWHVRGMRYPDIDEPEDINQYDALNLFIERALQIRRDFSPGDEQLAIIQICQLVDGLPLAIELAAGWLKTLSCAGIIKQIEQGIDFLATQNRDVPKRHRSIRAVFDHSWSLLSADEQAVFPRLSVFRGGFTLDAAEKVANADLMTLSSLVEKSMVRRDASGRYDLHEQLRQYAKEKLEIIDKIEATRDAHKDYYAIFMREHAIDIKGRRQIDGLNEIANDFDNIIEAWRYAIETVNYDTLDMMMEALALFCEIRARYQLGDDLFQLVVSNLLHLNTDEIHPVFNRLRARFIQVWLLPERYPIPEHRLQLLEDCLTEAEKQNDTQTVMLCYWLTGELSHIRGSYDDYSGADYTTSFTNYDHALSLARELGTRYYEGRILRSIDHIRTAIQNDDSPDARQISYLAQEITRQISDIHGMAHLLLHQFALYIEYTRTHPEAEIYLQESMSLFMSVKDLKSIGIVKSDLGWRYFEKGDFITAERFFVEAEQILTSVSFKGNVYGAIYPGLSRLHSIQGRYKEGYRYAQKSYLHRRRWFHIDMTYYFIGVSDFDNARHHLKLTFKGGGLDYYEAILVAFLLNHDREYVRSVEYISLACHHPRSLLGWMEQWDLLTQLKVDLIAELGDEAYTTAWERGAQLDLQDAFAKIRLYWSDEESNLHEPPTQPLIEPLTTRELEVLEWLGHGHSNPQIAEELTVVVGTVKRHVYHICQKLDVQNRTQAVIRAKQLGLL